jgi:site-specific recombinase XerD
LPHHLTQHVSHGVLVGDYRGGSLLEHRSITSTAVYTALAPNRFKDFWRE